MKHVRLVALVAGGNFLAPVNSTMITVALPTLRSHFGVGVSEVAWLVAVYLVAMAAMQPLTGRLGDRFGHRRLFLAGCLSMLAAAALCAVAPNLPWLVVGRALQGLSLAAMSPNGRAILRHHIPVGQQGRAFGLSGTLNSAGAAAGPPLGALLAATLGWQSIFWVNVPVLALVFLLGLRYLPETPPETGPGGGLGIDLRLFRHPAYSAASLAILLSNFMMYTVMLLVPFYVENILGREPGAAGLALGIYAALMGLLGPVGGWFYDRGSKVGPALAGALLLTGCALLLTTVHQGSSLLLIVAALVVGGFAVGIQGTPLEAAAMQSAPPAMAGSAAGVYSTARYIGSITCSIVIGAVLGPEPSAEGMRLILWVVAAAGALLVPVTLALRLAGRPYGLLRML